MSSPQAALALKHMCTRRYQLRPESIESNFILHALTKDPKAGAAFEACCSKLKDPEDPTAGAAFDARFPELPFTGKLKAASKPSRLVLAGRYLAAQPARQVLRLLHAFQTSPQQ